MHTQTFLQQDNMGLLLNSTKDIQARQEVTNMLLQNMLIELHNYNAIQLQQRNATGMSILK